MFCRGVVLMEDNYIPVQLLTVIGTFTVFGRKISAHSIRLPVNLTTHITKPFYDHDRSG